MSAHSELMSTPASFPQFSSCDEIFSRVNAEMVLVPRDMKFPVLSALISVTVFFRLL